MSSLVLFIVIYLVGISLTYVVTTKLKKYLMIPDYEIEYHRGNFHSWWTNEQIHLSFSLVWPLFWLFKVLHFILMLIIILIDTTFNIID